MTIATNRERLVSRILGSIFGLYPSASAALVTFLRVRSETLAPAVNVRETADCETPATLATSVDDGYFLAREIGSPILFEWSSAGFG